MFFYNFDLSNEVLRTTTVELVCIVLELQCIIVRCHFSTDVYDQQQQLKRWLDLYDSTSIRPLYDHSTTYVTTVGRPVVGQCSLNK